MAARIESIAEPGGVCISSSVRDSVGNRLDLAFEDMGAFVYGSARRRCCAAANLPLPDKPSIAILAFQNIGGDPEEEYFADSIVEEISTALSRMRWLFVIARNLSFTYKGRGVEVKQVGRELAVCYVLKGSVR